MLHSLLYSDFQNYKIPTDSIRKIRQNPFIHAVLNLGAYHTKNMQHLNSTLQ